MLIRSDMKNSVDRVYGSAVGNLIESSYKPHSRVESSIENIGLLIKENRSEKREERFRIEWMK